MDLQYEKALEKFKTNLISMRNRIKDRVRVAAFSYGSLRQGHMPTLNSATALRATATGLVVARVFKGNVILSRLVHSKAKQEWALKMAKFSAYFPNLGTKFVSPAAAEANASGAPRKCDHGAEISANKPASGQRIVNFEDSGVVRMLQAVAVPLLGNVCHAFMHGLNYTEVYGAEKLEEAITHRPKGQPLITVSNHVASVDDPFVISSVLPPRLLLDAKSIRWTLCATDRCFTNEVTSAFFRCVKVLPVSRGEGLYQKGMEMALSKLNQGHWVHIFPEGSRSRDGGKTISPAKRGVGRLVLDADNVPLVVPFVHAGMQDVMPIGSQFPHVRKKVTVLVGDPIKIDDLFLASKEHGFSKKKLYDAISLRVGERLQELKKELDELMHQPIKSQSETPASAYKIAETKAYKNSETDCLHEQADGLKHGLHEGYIHIDDIGLQGGIVSRLQRFMDPSTLMGFAARGMFMNVENKLEQSMTFHDWRQPAVMIGDNLGSKISQKGQKAASFRCKSSLIQC